MSEKVDYTKFNASNAFHIYKNINNDRLKEVIDRIVERAEYHYEIDIDLLPTSIVTELERRSFRIVKMGNKHRVNWFQLT